MPLNTNVPIMPMPPPLPPPLPPMPAKEKADEEMAPVRKSLPPVQSPTSGPFFHPAAPPSQAVHVDGVETPKPPAQQQKKTTEKKKKFKPKSKNRSGSPNYTAEEIDRLLEIVEDVLPMGSNEWAIVEKRFKDDGEEISVIRDQDSLKKKFDKLAATRKSTGDPSFPADVRKAKHIARDINGRANSGVVGDSSDEEEMMVENTHSGSPGGKGSESPGVVAGSTASSRVVSVGRNKRKRAEASRGVKKSRGTGVEDEMAVHVESMSDAVTELMKNMTGRKQGAIDMAAVDERVQGKVEVEIADTKRLINEQKQSIDELKNMVAALLNRSK